MSHAIPRLLPLLGAALTAAAAHAAPTGAEWTLSSRASARIQAVATLSGGAAATTPCLTPSLQTARAEGGSVPAALRRSIGLLGTDPSLAGERRVVEREVVVRFTTERGSADRIDAVDDNANGRPDAVDAVLAGATRAQRLLSGGLEFPSPAAIEIVLARLGSGIEGVALPARDGRITIWLDSSVRSGPALRRMAEHQIAHAYASVMGVGPAWSESLATWVANELEGGPDDRGAAQIAQRLARLADGLDREEIASSGGNAIWLAFLDEAYGRTAVKLAVEELAKGGSTDAALDRALRRAGAGSFEQAFREFHLWSVLTGPRDDRRHFSFASRLPGPAFASVAEMLPALSIQADPEVGPLGAANVLIAPSERTGGLAVRFEGDPTTRWSVDVLLVRLDGTMHRLPVPLGEDDSGGVTVPLQDLREALLLVRQVDGDGRTPRRYTWSAFVEPGYPTEIARLSAEPAGARGGMIVSWETTGEWGVLGFNVLRTRSGDDGETRVNPVWIPAIGDPGTAAAYSFLDPAARPGVTYQYRIEAVTPEGLASRSEAVSAPSR